MAQMKVPSVDDDSILTIKYGTLLGIDCQNNPVEVDRQRSPEMVNMISDEGGIPVKRYGYRTLGGIYYYGFANASGENYGIYLSSNCYYITKVKNDEYGVIDSYGNSTQISELTSDVLGDLKHFFGLGVYVYALFEKAWFEIDISGDTATVKGIGLCENLAYKFVDYGTDFTNSIQAIKPDDKYIPTVSTMRAPDGNSTVNLTSTSSDGTTTSADTTGSTQGINLLTPWRTVEFCITKDNVPSDNVVKLPSEYSALFEIQATQSTYTGKQFAKVEILNESTYEWEEVFVNPVTTTNIHNFSYYHLPDGTLCEDNGYLALPSFTVTITDKSGNTVFPYQVTTDSSDLKHLVFSMDTTAEVPANTPNIRITFCPYFTTNAADGYDNGMYREGRKNAFASDVVSAFESRLFLAEGVHTYYSRASSPLQIDDDWYFDVDNDVMAYAKSSSYIVVISEDTGKNTLYLASGSFDSTTQMTIYSIKSSNSGIGAVSKKCLGTLNDEPLFLSHNGVYALSTNYLSEKYAVCRSGKINKKLLEEDLSSAVGINHNNYFYVAVGGHMYVLDGRHSSTSRKSDTSYECYYFDNMPDITHMFVLNNRMYFMDGTSLYTWNDALEGTKRYMDIVSSDYHENSVVKAKWTSVMDGDGYPHYYKTLTKKGTIITIAEDENTSCEVTFIKDGKDEFYLGKFNGQNMRLNSIVLDAITKRKVKKYKRLQIVIENREAEPFGLIEIIKTSQLTNYAKR